MKSFFYSTLFFIGLSSVLSFEPLYIKPKHNAQEKFQQVFQNKNSKIICNIGVAGTGKTMMSCQESIKSLIEKEKERIILTRPSVSVENEEFGFLPGDLNEKMDPWMKPCFDYFRPFLLKSTTLQKKIEVCPIAYMRGRTFDNSIIIVEEAQNTTPLQMKLILTRIGKNSKIILNGDVTQSDLDGMNGLDDFLNRIQLNYYNNYEIEKDGFNIIHYKPENILRNSIIKTITTLYKD